MPHIPRLELSGGSIQLIVDDQPFLMLGGEIGNSSASDPSELGSMFAKLRAMNLNTVLVPVYWDLTEPSEGDFDFLLVEASISAARAHGLRLVLLWFAMGT
jgi:beta-galactosidase GanA